MKQRYIRVSYSNEFELNHMVQTHCLAGQEKWLTVLLRPGDFVLAAQFDRDRGAGEVRQVGLVQVSQGRLEIDWKPAQFTLSPSPQGITQWINLRSFEFHSPVAERYNLKEKCERLFPERSTQETSHSNIGGKGMANSMVPDPGYIYVIKSAHGYKIGKSKNLKDRTRIFEVKLPFPIELEMYGWSPAYSDMERHLHRVFAHKRLEGEWFRLEAIDLAQLRKELGTHKPDGQGL